MMTNILLAGLLSSIGFVLIAAKLNRTFLRRLLGYDLFFDVIITIGFVIVMMGTFSGAMTAMISGICISITLWVTKKLIGYEKFDIKSIKWISYPGRWTRE